MTSDTQQKSVDVQMPKRREGLIERELPEELVLYDPATDWAFLLNRMSAAIWDLCDGQHSTTQIAEQIAMHCGVPVGRVLEDAASTIARFEDKHLLADDDHVA